MIVTNTDPTQPSASWRRGARTTKVYRLQILKSPLGI